MENKERRHCRKRIAYPHSSYTSILGDFAKNNKLYDVGIKVKKQTFWAHKHILAEAIDYFDKMFSNNFLESHQEIITIRNIKPNNMELFLKFAYTGKFSITKVNAKDFFIDAFYLGLTECSKFLKSCLTPNNALEIYFLAEALGYISLKEQCYRFVQENFLNISLTNKYLKLSINTLKDILSNNDPDDTLQEEVVEVIIRWVKHNLKKRKKYLLDLLKIVDFLRIPALKISKIEEIEFIEREVECSDFLCKKFFAKMLFDDDYAIMVVGANYRAESSLELYHPNINKWGAMKTMKRFDREFHYCSSIVCMDKVYIDAVGKNDRSEVWVFDSKKGSLYSLPSMRIERCFSGLATSNGHLYACGGLTTSNNVVANVERYTPWMNRWERISSLNYPRSHIATISLKDHIYAFGGLHNFDSSNLVERYDSKSNKWMIIDSTMLRKRHFCGAVILNEKIYICGGQSEKNKITEILDSVEVYDPKSNCWEYVASMNEARYSSVVVAHMNKLWIFGGRSTDNAVLSSAEVYDPENNIWSYVSSMEKKSQFLFGVILKK